MQKVKLVTLFFLATLLLKIYTADAQVKSRPFIWIKEADRSALLSKIKTQLWAAKYYNAFKARLDEEIRPYEDNKESFLRQLPFDLKNQVAGKTPPFLYYFDEDDKQRPYAIAMMRQLETGIDCGVLYFITNDNRYAQCATDILNAFIQAMSQMKPSDNLNNGGYIYTTDHLREAREIGAQLPIIYDLIAPFISGKGRAYDLGAKSMIDFPKDKAQNVFRTYIDLALKHGLINCNWPVLESPSLVGNILALDDESERRQFLKYYLTINTPHQDALQKVDSVYRAHNGVWPETSTYANAVSDYTTYLMLLLTRYQPDLHLGHKYPEIPLALDAWNFLKYPNGDVIGFGDGVRRFDEDYLGYEFANSLGRFDSEKKLTEKFESLLVSKMANGEYARDALPPRYYGPNIYNKPLQLLWGSPELHGEQQSILLPRTNELSHAGIYLQRNPAVTDNKMNGLMAFVGGGHFVHAHASGMDMELYGKGHILGAYPGLAPYGTELTQNYYKLFAAHNTVIINGSSQGAGGWINIGINQVKKAAMEPEPFQQAVSPNHSFTITTFIDDRRDSKPNTPDPTSANATKALVAKADNIADLSIGDQEKTLAVIRTSDTTGYYVDIFRSRSKAPAQYHDYIYHNLGDKLEFLNVTGQFRLHADSNRFQGNAGKPWINNRSYRNPGWHYFKSVESSDEYNGNVEALFRSRFKDVGEVNMKVFIPGTDNRTYTRVMAPPTYEAPSPYQNKLTPALVIRKTGEAWANPFALVFEPIAGDRSQGSVRSVENILDHGIFKGLAIGSVIGGKSFMQYIITQETDEVFSSVKLGITFKGKFGVFTFLGNQIKSVYIGNGKDFSYKNISFRSGDGKDFAAYIDLDSPKPEVKTNGKVIYKF